MSVLTGIRIIELAHERTAFAGKLLAELGADVILIEPPEGTAARHYPPFVDDVPGIERSLHFWHYNAGKRGITLDLTRSGDQTRLRTLLATADVLIESEPSERIRALRLNFETTAKANPRLIHVAVTPYGRKEPLSNLAETDLTLMASGGPVWSCGYDDHSLPPSRGWGFQGYQTACHFAVMSVLTALLYRGNQTSGGGQFIDISITAALNVTTEGASYNWLVEGSTLQRQTGRHASIRPTGETQIQCADQRWANTGVPPRFPVEFARLLDWLRTLGLEEEFPEAVFLEMGANWEGPFDLSRIGIEDTITAVFTAGREALQLIARTVPAQSFFEGCQQAGLAVGVINSPEEAFEDIHFKARGMHVPLYRADLDRTVVHPGPPFSLPAAPSRLTRTAPRLGEHNAEIRGMP